MVFCNFHPENHLYRRRSHRDARGAAGAGRQWLACPVWGPVNVPASMNADAVRFPKGVFPPDADFGKGGHVPTTHDGSGGVQRGRTVGSAPLGRLFWYFSARGRKVHFSTVGGLHGVRPSGQRTLFIKTLSADVRRVPPWAKNYFSIRAYAIALTFPLSASPPPPTGGRSPASRAQLCPPTRRSSRQPLHTPSRSSSRRARRAIWPRCRR